MVKRKQLEPAIDDEILTHSISELKHTIDWLNSAYESIKAKTLAFLGAGLALLTYLYSSGDLFFPDEMYGRIFYCIGLALVLTSLVMLFRSLWPRRWEFTIDSNDLEDMNFTDKNHYLQYVKEIHIKAYRANLLTYTKNHKILHTAFFPLIVGAIILVVLKIFGT